MIYCALMVLQETFTSTLTQYTKTMSKWTQNIGGDDGNAEAIVVYQNRAAIDTCT